MVCKACRMTRFWSERPNKVQLAFGCDFHHCVFNSSDTNKKQKTDGEGDDSDDDEGKSKEAKSSSSAAPNNAGSVPMSMSMTMSGDSNMMAMQNAGFPGMNPGVNMN